MSGNCVIYIRCSTSKQSTSGYSLETQRKGCIEYAKKRKLHIKGFYTDDGVSGVSLAGRVQFQAALKALKEGDVFLVYSLSRVSRSLEDMVDIMRMIKARKCKILSYTENLEDPKYGMLNAEIGTVMAKFESQQIGERVKDTMTRLKDSRGSSNLKARYGYRYDRDVKDEFGKLVLLPNEEEQKVIAIIKELRSQMWHNPRHPKIIEEPLPYSHIADELNKRNIPTRTKNRDPHKPARKWYASTVKKILDAEEEMAEELERIESEKNDPHNFITDIIYLIMIGKSTRMVGSSFHPTELYHEYKSNPIDKISLYLFPCESHEQSLEQLLSWLKNGDHVEDDKVLSYDISTDDVLKQMKEITTRDYVRYTMQELIDTFSIPTD